MAAAAGGGSLKLPASARTEVLFERSAGDIGDRHTAPLGLMTESGIEVIRELHGGASHGMPAYQGAGGPRNFELDHEFRPLPGAKHVLQTHREDDVSLDAAMTGDHHRQGILHAGNHSHPIRKADVDRHRSIEGGGLE